MTSNKLENLPHLVGWFSWKYDVARTCKTQICVLCLHISIAIGCLFCEFRSRCHESSILLGWYIRITDVCYYLCRQCER